MFNQDMLQTEISLMKTKELQSKKPTLTQSIDHENLPVKLSGLPSFDGDRMLQDVARLLPAPDKLLILGELQ